MTDKRIKMECPFCHCPPEKVLIERDMNIENIIENIFLYGTTERYRVECPECGATFNTYDNKQEAIDRWNRR